MPNLINKTIEVIKNIIGKAIAKIVKKLKLLLAPTKYPSGNSNLTVNASPGFNVPENTPVITFPSTV